MKSAENDSVEQRKFRRLRTVLPIDFSIVRLQGDLPGIDALRGTTQNVSQSGICLETDLLDDSTLQYIFNNKIYLDMRIHLPPGLGSIQAVGEAMWYKRLEQESSIKYTIGMKFRSIAEIDLKKLLALASGIQYLLNLIVIIALIIFISLIWIRMTSSGTGSE